MLIGITARTAYPASQARGEDHRQVQKGSVISPDQTPAFRKEELCPRLRGLSRNSLGHDSSRELRPFPTQSLDLPTPLCLETVPKGLPRRVSFELPNKVESTFSQVLENFLRRAGIMNWKLTA